MRIGSDDSDDCDSVSPHWLPNQRTLPTADCLVSMGNNLVQRCVQIKVDPSCLASVLSSPPCFGLPACSACNLAVCPVCAALLPCLPCLPCLPRPYLDPIHCNQPPPICIHIWHRGILLRVESQFSFLLHPPQPPISTLLTHLNLPSPHFFLCSR